MKTPNLYFQPDISLNAHPYFYTLTFRNSQHKAYKLSHKTIITITTESDNLSHRKPTDYIFSPFHMQIPFVLKNDKGKYETS